MFRPRVPASAERRWRILVLRRRPEPLIAQRDGYQRFVDEVFTGRGRGLGAIVRPSELDARGWATLHRACGGA